MPKNGKSDTHDTGSQSADDYIGGQYEHSAYVAAGRNAIEIAEPVDKPKNGAAARLPGTYSPAIKRAVPKADWFQRAIAGKSGTVLSNAANIYLALTEDPHWCGRITRDVVQCQNLLDGKPITDETVAEIQRWLQLAGLTGAKIGEVHNQASAIAHENAFDPLKEHLESLEWDGTPRLDNWLFTFLGAEAEDDDKTKEGRKRKRRQQKYIRLAGRYWLIQAVARAFEPGCKADYTLIPQGMQGTLKSTACGVLGGEWFSENMPIDVTSKDASQHLRGKWVVEIAELGAFSKSEVTHLKAFLTRREERYRPSFGRCEVREPRRCVFIATTNEERYLRDESGGRRFWPISTASVDLEALKRDRDLLLAEAVKEYKKGARYWPSRREENVYFAQEQDRRYQGDPWEEAVAEYVDGRKEVTVGQIAFEKLGFEAKRIQRSDQNRIMAILKSLGWKSGTRLGSRRPWIKNA